MLPLAILLGCLGHQHDHDARGCYSVKRAVRDGHDHIPQLTSSQCSSHGRCLGQALCALLLTAFQQILQPEQASQSEKL